MTTRLRIYALGLLGFAALTRPVCAQQAPLSSAISSPDLAQSDQTQPPAQSGTPAGDTTAQDETPVTLFPHSESSRWYLAGQMNFIFQWHPSFPAKYNGPQSLDPDAEHASSRVLTLFAGLELTHTVEILFDLEETGGRGISNAFGLAGFTNLDVVRNPSLGRIPYIARGMLHVTIPLSSDRVSAECSFLGLATSVPARRLEFRIGKIGVNDFFDVNSAGTDSHLQFLNWTIDQNGAYDYAADTRGYTVGGLVEYEDHIWGVRFAEALMPTIANSIDYQWNLSRARSENAEFELRRGLVPHRDGTIRLLSYVNHANMGDYRVAIEQYLAGETPTPEITHHPLQTTAKYGFGINLEEHLTSSLTAFGRFGWNEGRHESFAYTEVNQTFSGGAVLAGSLWKRRHDRFGAAFVSNAISGDHREYLALGGCGFLLCDGALNYGREKIFETFYTAHLWRGVFGSIDLQHINNPGYNRDRGPVFVPTLRLHVDL
ncbi:MAG: carbohydrate porin [Candidatus Acidiferrales bacterium]